MKYLLMYITRRENEVATNDDVTSTEMAETEFYNNKIETYCVVQCKRISTSPTNGFNGHDYYKHDNKNVTSVSSQRTKDTQAYEILQSLNYLIYSLVTPR